MAGQPGKTRRWKYIGGGMTNEELAALIQGGRTEYVPQLWGQVEGFINMRAGRCLDGFPQHMWQYRGDMVNEAYPYFLKAIGTFDPGKGAFTTWLSWHVRRAFTAVLMGGRGKDPLNGAASLDAPVRDAEGLTLADALIDDESEACYRHIEDADFWRSVNELLSDAIDHIRDGVGRDLVRHMFHSGSTIREASEALYGCCPVPYGHYRKAIRQLRGYLNYSTVRERLEASGLDGYVRGWGVRAWESHGFTSSVEHVAVKRTDRQAVLDGMGEMIRDGRRTAAENGERAAGRDLTKLDPGKCTGSANQAPEKNGAALRRGTGRRPLQRGIAREAP